MSFLLTIGVVASLLLAVAYVALLRFYVRGWQALPLWQVPAAWRPATRVSVIIPARNEADRIEVCVRSVLSQSYPAELLQVIVVDDHSEDATARQVAAIDHPCLELLRLADTEGKKAALAGGIAAARGELIITTDADCAAPAAWLALLVSFYERYRPAFIAAPVCFSRERNWFQRFQSLDYLGMMVLTGGGIARRFTHLSNGANLAFPREVFFEVDGYQGIDGPASGDDLLLMHKIARCYPRRVAFLKNPAAAVLTEAMPDWHAFFNQRLRWATKSSHYQDRRLLPVTALVFLFCLSIPLSLLAAFLVGPPFLLLFLFLLLTKWLADYFLLAAATAFFGRRDLLRAFWRSQGWHLVYILAVGAASFWRKQYKWKGRWVR